jgi:BolA protein
VETILNHDFPLGAKSARGKDQTRGILSMTGPVAREMKALLVAAFAPSQLEIINDSGLHAGHSGHDGSGESHFTIAITAAAFSGMSRVARQRAVNKALGDIPGERVHALAIKAKSPEETGAPQE